MESGKDLLNDLFSSSVGLDSELFNIGLELSDQNKHVSKTSSAFHKDEHSPLVKIRSMDNLQSVSIAKDSSTVDFGRTLEQSHPVDLKSVSQEMPMYLLEGDEGNDEEIMGLWPGTSRDEDFRKPTLFRNVTSSNQEPDTRNGLTRGQSTEAVENGNKASNSINGETTGRETTNHSPNWSCPVLSSVPNSCQDGSESRESDPQSVSSPLYVPSNSESVSLHSISCFSSSHITALATSLCGQEIPAHLISSELELVAIGNNGISVVPSQLTSTASLSHGGEFHCSDPKPLEPSTGFSANRFSCSGVGISETQCSVESNDPSSPDSSSQSVNSSSSVEECQRVKELLKLHFARVNRRNARKRQKCKANGGWTKGKRRKTDLELLKPPKPPSTSFGIFQKETYSELVPKDEGLKVSEISKQLGKQWSSLPVETKAGFQAKAESDRKRFIMELLDYLERKLQGLSESQPSVESLIGLSFKSLDDDNCLYCPICRLSFFNIHGKQSHFCGRPHVMELVTRLEDIERKRKEGWVLETCDEELLFGRPDLRGVPVDEHTRNRFISETQKSVGLNEGNIHRKDNVTVSEKRNKQCDEDVRLLLRKKLLETNPHLGNNCHDTRIGQESKNEPSSHT